MDLRTLFLQLQHVCQIVLCAYGFRHSMVAITNLSKYEAATKKVAKWSKEVENQLFKTRMTQGTGILTIIVSLFAAVNLLIAHRYLPTWALYSTSPAVLVIVLGARRYIKNFWAPQTDARSKDVGTKVPLLPSMQDYNLAVQKTEDLLKVLEYLEYSWVISSLMTVIVGYK